MKGSGRRVLALIVAAVIGVIAFVTWKDGEDPPWFLLGVALVWVVFVFWSSRKQPTAGEDPANAGEG